MEEDAELILHNMRIPDYILQMALQQNSLTLPEMMSMHRYTQPPEYPTLVFVNSKSGGQQGRRFASPCRVLLTPLQVIDLQEGVPEKLLPKILGDLERLSTEGDQVAAAVKEKLRIIVAGGDGTAGWVLGIIAEMKLFHPPPIAPVPLGTGNNLPYSFGWGRKNILIDLNSVKSLLVEVAKAKVMKVDSWLVTMKIPIATMGALRPFTLPHSMHASDIASSPDNNHESKTLIFHGGFWNYFSLGMDAQVAYSFHNRRQKCPDNFTSQLKNQSSYATLSCAQGWFCVSCFHPSSRNINHLGKIMYTKHDEEWKELDISPSIRSIVLLNLPSFSGGFNPWGNPTDKISIKRSLTEQLVDDGILEIVGFRDGWHGLSLLFPGGHGKRLAQAHKVRMEVSHANLTFMRMDGEPWLQPLPEKESSTIIEITRGGQGLVLATERHIAQNSAMHRDVANDGRSESKQPRGQTSRTVGLGGVR